MWKRRSLEKERKMQEQAGEEHKQNTTPGPGEKLGINSIH
jgi:hypothetical protein